VCVRYEDVPIYMCNEDGGVPEAGGTAAAATGSV
jgi:hypothetical protein